MNYAKNLPRDTGGAPMQEYPTPFRAVQARVATNQAASSVITLNADTTTLEVGAYGGQGMVFRWVPTTETAMASSVWNASVIASGAGANFDHFVPPSAVRRFVVPRETQGQYAGQVGALNGLYNRVAVVNAGTTATSILLAEY